MSSRPAWATPLPGLTEEEAELYEFWRFLKMNYVHVSSWEVCICESALVRRAWDPRLLESSSCDLGTGLVLCKSSAHP